MLSLFSTFFFLISTILARTTTFVGFDTADGENVGASVSVVTNNNQELADKVAEDVAKYFWSLRDEFIRPMIPPKDAVKMAMESEGPVACAIKLPKSFLPVSHLNFYNIG